MNIPVQSWAAFKTLLSSKKLLIQYYDNGLSYIIWAVEGGVMYLYTIWLAGNEPVDSDVAQITADRTDFETNFKDTANQPTTAIVGYAEMPTIGATIPTIGTRAWIFSHDFCDKTTWYGESVQVVDEAVGTGDGTTVNFNFANQYLIDLSHGKVTDEDYIVDTYAPVVKINGVTQTEVPYGETSGDFTIDYEAGTITFAVAPATSAAITATYNYSPPNAASTLYIRPSPGNKLTITVAEVQFSKDFVMNDNIISSIWSYNPELGAPPAKFEYPGTRAKYKRLYDFINYTLGSYPIIPAMGGPDRGFSQDIIQLRYDYQSAFTLNSSYGAELRVWMEHNRVCDGQCATIAFYGYEEPE